MTRFIPVHGDTKESFGLRQGLPLKASILAAHCRYTARYARNAFAGQGAAPRSGRAPGREITILTYSREVQDGGLAPPTLTYSSTGLPDPLSRGDWQLSARCESTGVFMPRLNLGHNWPPIVPLDSAGRAVGCSLFGLAPLHLGLQLLDSKKGSTKRAVVLQSDHLRLLVVPDIQQCYPTAFLCLRFEVMLWTASFDKVSHAGQGLHDCDKGALGQHSRSSLDSVPKGE